MWMNGLDENLEINCHMYSPLIVDKGVKPVQWAKYSPVIKGCRDNWISTGTKKKKKNLDPNITLYIKFNSNALKIKGRANAIQILGENKGVTFITLDLVMVSQV